MPPNCCFIENSTRCLRPRKPLSNFCEKHQQFFKAQSNQEIIEKLSTAVRSCIFVDPNKKISPAQDKGAWIPFINLFNEMIDRGYKYEEVMLSVKSQQETTGVLDDILAEIGRDPKWKRFEKIVNAIHELKSEGAEVKLDDEIIGQRTGRPRQIDISARFKHGYYSYLIVVECKDYNGRIPIEKVEAFRAKIEDVGAQKGIMVSSGGFQAGAEATAKAYNIELFTLEEVKTDWSQVVREIAISVPFPQLVQFDYMQSDRFPQSGVTGPLSFQDILIYKDQFEPPESLAKICCDLSMSVRDRKLALPLEMHFKFEETRFLKVPSLIDYIPLFGLKILFMEYRFKKQNNIDIAPQVVSYRYSDIFKRTDHIIPAEAIKAKINQ
jgi:hypothetical protein